MMLQDQVAVITGGAQGLGRAIASRFLDHGARVILADLDGEAASRTAAQLDPDRAIGVACDVARESCVEALFAAVDTAQGRVDVLVNNAGITRDAMLHKMTLGQFRDVIDVHLQGAWLCSRAAMKRMRGGAGGAIINMSSISAKAGNLGQTNYAAAKAGIVAMTKATAREGARHGVRANAIQPGLIRSAMTEAMPEEVWDEKLAGIPLGRAGEPDEIADVALFLASGMSSYVTGAVIEVAGGRHL